MKQRQRVKTKIKFRKRTPFDESFFMGMVTALLIEKILPDTLKLPALTMLQKEMQYTSMSSMNMEHSEETKQPEAKNIHLKNSKR